MALCLFVALLFLASPSRGNDQVPVDLEQVTADLQRACNEGARRDCYSLGDFYGNREKYGQALPLLKRSCDMGYPYACGQLAEWYRDGLGVNKNYGEAVRLRARELDFFKAGCAGNDSELCQGLALKYRDGDGTPQNCPEALRIIKQYCEGGDNFMCSEFGKMHEEGVCVSVDVERAVKIHRTLCEQGYGHSCSHLAELYEKGKHVKQDIDQAVVLYSKNCLRWPGGIECIQLQVLCEKSRRPGCP